MKIKLNFFLIFQFFYGSNRKEENICILLIERGADVRVVDGLDRSYMHIAATYDLPNVIGVLAARGADVNARVSVCISLHLVVQPQLPMPLFLG